MAGRWVYPLDPTCPRVEAYYKAVNEDPMCEYAPMDEINEDFERRHRMNCKQCQAYGTANVDVSYD